MSQVGVIEGFFGPAWPRAQGPSLAEFLSRENFQFYIYAPKSDAHLRKKWREPWGSDFLDPLKGLSRVFQEKNVRFGAGLSPFELDLSRDKDLLVAKVEALEQSGVQILGLFFDDMMSMDGTFEAQMRVLDLIRSKTSCEIWYCPTFYSFDPILEKVFGRRPEGYFSNLGDQVPSSVDILWTGPKVISNEISIEHLQEVTGILKRKPVIWDNVFANDGPKQCKFLKLKEASGRNPSVFEHAKAWAFNPMNQLRLSEISVLATKVGFQAAAQRLCDQMTADFILRHHQGLLAKSLDVLTMEEKQEVEKGLSLQDPAAVEIKAWLAGSYNVGSECLTD